MEHNWAVKGAVGKWLEQEFLDWQRGQGERKTIAEFAKWLGFSRGTLNHWLNGTRRPDKVSADQIAAKLGPEIYDLLGILRPDPDLEAIVRNWARIREGLRRQWAQIAERGEEYGKDEGDNG